MKLLAIGDVVGKPGRDAVRKAVAELKDQQFDFIIANVENLAHGKGITPESLRDLQEAGVQAFTSGNHAWDKKEGLPLLDDLKIPIVRPANFPPGVPGRGYCFVENNGKKLAIINMQGRVFMKQDLDCPFRTTETILAEIAAEITEEKPDAIILDLHAEASSEKMAMGFYFDGRINLLYGTHTHTPTADERVLPKGSGFISDVGMCGLRDSILGFDMEPIFTHFLTQLPAKFEITPGSDLIFNAIVVEIDDNSGSVNAISRIQRIFS